MLTPADHRRLPLDDVASDEINVFCATVDAQKRKVIDMKKILARQIRRHNEAYERCRRLIDEGHEMLVDVLPSGKEQVLLKLEEVHRLMKARLEKFGEKMLLLAGDVTHIINVMERQLQFGLNGEVLALKKPAESKLGVMNRKIDDHFSAEQAVAQSLLRNGGEIGRELMRGLYRPQVATDSRRTSPVQTSELGALNGFGSSPSGSSPRLQPGAVSGTEPQPRIQLRPRSCSQTVARTAATSASDSRCLQSCLRCSTGTHPANCSHIRRLRSA